MIATHDQFTRQMENRLTTTCIGLGLVRLLQDARRFEEARTTLYSLEGFQGIEAEKTTQKATRSASESDKKIFAKVRQKNCGGGGVNLAEML